MQAGTSHYFGDGFAKAFNILVMGTVTASGIPEAIAAAILVLALGKVLVVVFRKMNLGAVNVESAK